MRNQKIKKYLRKELIHFNFYNQIKKKLSNKKKKDKSNTSLHYFFEKKKVQNFLIDEKKTVFCYNLSIKKKRFKIWDKEKKLVYFGSQSEYHGILLAQKRYIYIEEYLGLNPLENQPINLKKNLCKILRLFLSCFKSYLHIQQILLYIYLKDLGLIVSRFYLRTKLAINPDYICWSKKKKVNFIFNIILHKTNTIFDCYFNISTLLARVKPGLLKIAYFGLSSFVFFSIEAGFFINCPIYIKQKKYKKKDVI
nr:hypothetical protein CcurKRNrm1_p097 [Cryptomonas curvata]